MTSINFNAAATTALRTLQQTNSSLETSQNRVSTGLKIGEAKDNAAYWSITTTLKSDNKSLGTVKDALSLGSATIDTAYQGLNKTLEVLNEIKTKLTASTQDGVDKVAVQSEISELQKQLTAIATAATFSGENWLSVDSTPSTYSATKSLVASFNRTNGVVALDTISIDTSNFVLIDNKINNTSGALEGTTTATVPAGTLATAIGAAAGAGTVADPAVINFSAMALGRDDQINFTMAVNGATPPLNVYIDTALVNSTLAVTDGRIDDVSAFKKVLDAAFLKAGATVTTATGTGTVEVNSTTSIVFASAAASGKGGVLQLDITGKTRAQIEGMIQTVDVASKKVTAGAAQLGAVAKRVSLQENFVSTLMDTIDKGVSDLIDADLSEESTRLQALQTKQQLGIQALSIANSSTQNILSLFRS